MSWKYNKNQIDSITADRGLDMTTAGAAAVSPRSVHTGGAPAVTTTPGSAQTPVITETYFAELSVPCTMEVTGVAVFNGTDVTGNVKLGLYDARGNLVAETASTAGSGTAQYQRVPFTAPVKLVGPGSYYVARQASNVAARPCAHAVGSFGAGKTTGDTYGTLPTAPALPTTFTTALGPIASLY
jgi:hypothetical protein